MPAKRKIKEVRANRFVLEDSKGRTKALLDASIDDEMVLFQMYHEERSMIEASIDPNGSPHLVLFNKAGKTAVGMGIDESFGWGISMNDSEGRPVCFIFVGSDGIPRIRLLDATEPRKVRTLWASPTGKRTRKTETAGKKPRPSKPASQ